MYKEHRYFEERNDKTKAAETPEKDSGIGFEETIKMLERIRIVLINTSHPGNIGSVARAMKTMGLSQLYLVAPQKFPHPKALEMASNAGDVVENKTGKVVKSFRKAPPD